MKSFGRMKNKVTESKGLTNMKRFFITAILLFAAATCLSQSRPRIIVATFNRPANFTAYQAGDAVQDSSTHLLNFVNAVPTKGYGNYVTDAYLSADTVNVANASFRLLLLSDSTGLSSVADNAPFTLLAAMAQYIVGYVNFTLVTEGSGSTLAHCLTTGLNLGFVPKTTSLFGVLICEGSYTPKGTGTFRIRLVVKE